MESCRYTRGSVLVKAHDYGKNAMLNTLRAGQYGMNAVLQGIFIAYARGACAL